MMAHVNAALPPTIPSTAHTTRQQIAPPKNCDIPDIFRYPNTSETKRLVQILPLRYQQQPQSKRTHQRQSNLMQMGKLVFVDSLSSFL